MENKGILTKENIFPHNIIKHSYHYRVVEVGRDLWVHLVPVPSTMARGCGRSPVRTISAPCSLCQGSPVLCSVPPPSRTAPGPPCPSPGLSPVHPYHQYWEHWRRLISVSAESASLNVFEVIKASVRDNLDKTENRRTCHTLDIPEWCAYASLHLKTFLHS